MTAFLDPQDIEQWRAWIGRTERLTEILSVEAARRYAAAVGAPLDVEAIAPPIGHWAFFLPVAPADGLGPDGHPARGGLLPPVALPRRMFAAARIAQLGPLRLGEAAEMRVEVRDVSHRSGQSGDLVLVEVERRLSQRGVELVVERQTLIYRGAGGVTPRPQAAPERSTGDEADLWRPGTVDLFRFSAATFNSHRIHYDRDYARGEEGYPDLVVHGPFTAVKLWGLAASRLGRAPRHFSFRATAPLFAGQPVQLLADAEPGVFKAVRCDGAVAMSASAT